MANRFVRSSSYRHVFGEVPKDDMSYCDLKPQVTDGDSCKANTKYYALTVTGGGGPVQIGALDKTGRLGNQPKLAVHKAKVMDFDFNPFIEEMIATGSDDCTAKVSIFPEGGIVKENVTKSECTLEGHQKKINIVKFHPTANNILATTSFDYTAKVWDIEAQAEIFSFDKMEEVPTSFDWNTDGSLCLTTCKDKKMRIFDPRAPEGSLEAAGFAGTKKSTALWVDNHQKIAAVGFGRTSGRAYRLYDPRNFTEHIQEVDIDQSAGVFMTHYDPDTSMLYLAGKGDSSIKYFEITEEKPFCHFLSEFRHGDSQKGIGWVPKRALRTNKCEIQRALRVLRDKVQPVSLQVPRKSEIFQADIFPDTYSGVSTQSAADYQGGGNSAPATQSMNPKNAPGAREAVKFEKKMSPSEMTARIAVLEKLLKDNGIEVPSA